MIDRTDSRTEWFAYEAKAASISQERRSEELQLEKLKLRLHNKMREAEIQEPARVRSVVACQRSFLLTPRRPALQFMSQTSAFHQLKDFFRQVFGMVPGALKRLCDKQQVGAVFPFMAVGLFQMAAENCAAGFVDAGISLQHPASGFDVAIQESPGEFAPACFPEFRPFPPLPGCHLLTVARPGFEAVLPPTIAGLQYAPDR